MKSLWAVALLLLLTGGCLRAQGLFSLDVRDADLIDVIRLLATESGTNMVADSSVGQARVTLRLHDVSFDQAVSALSNACELTTRRDGNVMTFLRMPASARGGAHRVTTAIGLRYARAADVAKQLRGVLPDGSFLADERVNAILISGEKPVQATARELVRALDRRTPQVMFEVRVADVVAANDNSNVGVVFGGAGAGGGPGQTLYTFANRSIAINATLNALVSQNHAKVLATPRLVTQNNREADLLVGQSYPVVTQNTAGSSTTQQVQYIDIGVKLAADADDRRRRNDHRGDASGIQHASGGNERRFSDHR